MIRQIILTPLFLLIVAGQIQAGWRSQVRAGDKLYEEGKYDEALVKYLEALSQKGDSTYAKFGLGNVFQNQEKFEEAAKSFQTILTSSDSLTRGEGFYNLGNALVGARQYDKAIQAYKQALRLNPGQMDYLHNLELAMHLMENPPPQQQQSSGGQNDQQKQDQKQDQQQSQEQKQQEQEADQEQQQQEQSEQEQEQAQHEQQKQQEEQMQAAQADSMSRQDAERLLNALQIDEKQVQENLHRKRAAEAGVGKDW